jgi:hypothetical protein
MDKNSGVPKSEDRSPFAPARTPRLSILHFMLWTFCSAAVLTLFRTIESLQGDLPEGYASVQRVSSVLSGVISGAVLAGAIVLVHTRVRGTPPMLRHPGHWLLLVTAIVTLTQLAAYVLILLLFGIGDMFFLLIYGATSLFAVIAYVLAVLRNVAVRWKVCFGAIAAIDALQGIFYVGIWAFGPQLAILTAVARWGHPFLAGWVAVVSLVDLVVGQRRDWLHWTGVTTYAMTSGIALIWMIAAWFI